MNEGVISSYESFFSGSGLPSDLAVEMATATSMQASMEAGYQKEPTPQQSQPQHSRRYHHSSGYNNSFVITGDATAQTTCSTQMGFVCNTNNGVSGNGNNIVTNAFTQIPFVQIHTTDVQPQSAYNSTRFRRNATSNHEEIKAEPIKSENAEGAKERINATPTPSGSAQQRSENHTTKNSIQNEKDICSKNGSSNANGENAIVSNSENSAICSTEDTSFTLPAIHKCQHCAFISLNESELQPHVEGMHQANFHMNGNPIKRPAIQCPGCDNVFFAFAVVEIHLREDHLMSEQYVMELMQAIKNKNSASQHSTTTNNLKNSNEAVPNDTSMNGAQRRSRIYLKNVECLREPHRDPIEQQDNLITDSLFHFENDDCNTLVNIGSISMEEQDLIGILTSGEPTFHNKPDNNDRMVNETNTASLEVSKPVNPPKQKISIKSVDVLREPALLRRDYEMHTFDDFINVCSDLNLHVANNNSDRNNCDANVGRANDDEVQYNNYSVAANREPLVSSISNAGINDFVSGNEKPRKPKIYIKNVDILKEPITFSNNINAANITESNSNVMNFNFMQPSLPQIATSYLETVEGLNATVPKFNSGMSQLPLGTISDQYLFDSGSGNFLVNTTTNDSADTFGYGSEANSENFLMESNRFTETIPPIITEPTPPPPPMATAIDNTTDSTVDTPPAHHAAALTNVQKQKIFIKNVDILKEPQFQEPRGLLHLRTVDELNLMNRKDVENLIAPNLEGNQSNTAEEDIGDNFTQLNNVTRESSAVEHCNDSNVIGAISYDCEGFKLNEFSTQNSWHDDYDLGEDIREIITSTMTPNMPTSQKIIHDLDTPQVSLISIPDMAELAGVSVRVNVSTVSTTTSEETALGAVTVPQSHDNTNFTFECEINATDNAMQGPISSSDSPTNSAVVSHIALPEAPKEPAEMRADQLAGAAEVLKQERLNRNTPGEQTTTVLSPKNNATSFVDIPPLTPMSSATYTINTNVNTTSIAAPNGLPVPPLVPMLPPIQLSKTGAATNAAGTAATPAERGRIYVANNLMQTPSATLVLQNPTVAATITTNQQEIQQINTTTPIAVSVMGGTSVRGRPFGANRTGITKLRKQPPNGNGAGVYLKCTVTGCAFRFKKSSTLDYHIKCHSSDSPPQSMACPECKAPFTNWNSLHTHLWRSHKIDMELYSCELCSFKTPIYSRLLNTHSKIHYDERNYKCDQCDKAFKNTKQLKNHRRWHRNHNKATTSTTANRETFKKYDATSSESNDPASTSPSSITAATAAVPSTPARNFHRCKDCDAVFSHQKTLREHLCKNAAAAVQCEVCERVLTSRSSLKLHMQSHEPSRRFKCHTCDYSASDHNAFRRHKMTHDTNAKMYACVHCDYKSIQSVAYQKHVQQKHPQVADSIVYKCKICPYATINKALFDVHQVKHENKNDKNESNAGGSVAGENVVGGTEKSCSKKCVQNTVGEPVTKTKIKVKSHLLLTTPADATLEFSDICFDAVTMTA